LKPISPSSNNSNIHELNDKEINELIEKFRYSAELSLKAGFDGVEIHGANKYLLQQFYSPHTNQRNDKWGGSDENRMSFILKIIDAICNMRDEHKRSDFIIGYRLSPEEPFDDGITMNETLKLVKALLLKPIQYIHISQKNFYGKVRKGEGMGIERLKLIHDLTKNKVALIGVGGLKNENGINYAIKSGLTYLKILFTIN
jgi:2,4-dienoyl-CoA reductase-like NADH-dependent reductase (Old Yellow Enzyme family)